MFLEKCVHEFNLIGYYIAILVSLQKTALKGTPWSSVVPLIGALKICNCPLVHAA